MRAVRCWALAGSAALVASAMAMAGGAAASASPAPHRVALRGSLAPAAARKHPAGSVAAKSSVTFDLSLSLRNAAGARNFVRQVSTPGTKQFHHYLKYATWVSRFGPTKTALSKAEAWLRAQGFTVVSVPKTRLFVSARGTAARVEKAFGVKLGYYKVNGHKVRLASGTPSIPSSLAGAVTGVVGVNQYMQTTSLSQTGATPAAKANAEPPPPAGFRNPQPCSKFWGQKTDTADSGSLYKPFTAPLPYDICGYKPGQLRGAYQLASHVRAGDSGKGVGVAIVDAYDSPKLLTDAQHYFRLNDSGHPLASSQFFNSQPSTVTNADVCGGSGWYDEQALDVESVHSMAPGAAILYVGAQDCFDNNLLAAEQIAVTSGASVVSNSWGDTMGDLLEDAATKTVFDNTFMLAGSTGVSVMFSTGDDGDNFADFGLAVPDYPATSPFVTAVGGTTLEVNGNNARQAEFGWSTGKQVMCTSKTANCGSATTPAGALGWNAGDGVGTSYTYSQPFYQAGIVPDSLALRNRALFGPQPLRVIPDVSMDADAQSGMLIGLTQTFPSGTFYDQFKEGGTSLASPLMAGVTADAIQAAGGQFGFLNPVLYKASKTASTFDDIKPPANPKSTAVVRVDFANTVNSSDGFIMSLRQIDYQGPETFCDGTGNCATRNVIVSAGNGYDGLTGLGSIGNAFLNTMSRF
jgi:subtilase family serine protease